MVILLRILYYEVCAIYFDIHYEGDYHIWIVLNLENPKYGG